MNSILVVPLSFLHPKRQGFRTSSYNCRNFHPAVSALLLRPDFCCFLITFDRRGTHQRATHYLCSFSVFAQKFFEFLGIISKFLEFFGSLLKFLECLSGGKNVLKSSPLDEYPYPQRRPEIPTEYPPGN